MKLATRTGLASLGASALAIVVLSNVVATQFERVLRERVDERLTERAELSAPILVAVGDRISVSELNGVIESARVVTGVGTDAQRTVVVGPQPAGDLPAVDAAGLRTVDVGDESWRLLTVEVDDVPTVGDQAVVEFAEPLGAVQDRVREIRRRTFFAGVLAALGAGLVGWLFGRRAARPLTRLQHDAAAIGSSTPSALAVAERYGTPEVDDVAAALNASLADLGDAIERREEALAAARNFAASATHELRTPLQSAMTNLDVAMAGADSGTGSEAGSGGGSIGRARSELSRMATSLATVQALSQADLAQPEWFEPMDVEALGDVADEVTSRTSASTDATIDLEVDPAPAPPVTHSIWPDGVRLALDNVLRNAVSHGRPIGGAPGHIVVRVAASTPPRVIVDDNGPGVSPDDALRLLAPFERGSTTTPGSGLGLAVADRVARAHGGQVEILPSPMGGTRVRITLGPERQW
jgi:two-component system sensor histidine kinase PrrB